MKLYKFSPIRDLQSTLGEHTALAGQVSQTAEQSTTSCSEPSTAAKAAPNKEPRSTEKAACRTARGSRSECGGKDVHVVPQGVITCDYRGSDVLFSPSIPTI